MFSSKVVIAWFPNHWELVRWDLIVWKQTRRHGWARLQGLQCLNVPLAHCALYRATVYTQAILVYVFFSDTIQRPSCWYFSAPGMSHFLDQQCGSRISPGMAAWSLSARDFHWPVCCDHKRRTAVMHSFFLFSQSLDVFFCLSASLILKMVKWQSTSWSNWFVICHQTGGAREAFLNIQRTGSYDVPSAIFGHLRPSSSTWCPFCPFGHESNQHDVPSDITDLTRKGPLVA